MNINSLKPAHTLAANYGVKSILFGPPGVGKTPVLKTAPRPVLLVTEPGMLSMKDSNIPAFEAYSKEKVIEFFEWFFKSKEALSFDTLGLDSASQLCEIFLRAEQQKKTHGLKAYGNMAETVYWDFLSPLYYMPNKHIVLIAKQQLMENGKTAVMGDGKISYEPVMQKRPWFPGKDLNIKIPHLFDNVFQMDEVQIPGMQGLQKAFRTKEIPEVYARSRIQLSEIEPADFGYIFKKAGY